MRPDVKAISALVLLAFGALLSGCMGSLIPKAPDRAVYGLPQAQPMRARQPLPAALLVELPLAGAPLASRDIVVQREDGEIQVLPGVRWAAPAPQLLQNLIAQQIEAAGSAPSVAQTSQAHALPLRLAIELRAFELRDRQGQLSAHAAVSLRLICTHDTRIIAASPALAVEASPVPSQPAAATSALRESAAGLARQVVLWLDKVDTRSCKVD